MNLSNLYNSATGLVHFLSSLVAMVFAALVLFLPKGTRIHRMFGYLYILSMTVLLVTAFSIYELFKGWGVFHWSALFSALVIMAGFVPILLQRPKHNYVILHFSFMYWSIIGLYSAFLSETLVRIPKIVIVNDIPNEVFYQMTGVGTFVIMGLGALFFIRNYRGWKEIYQK
jgi:uncharacterized membrane protein